MVTRMPTSAATPTLRTTRRSTREPIRMCGAFGIIHDHAQQDGLAYEVAALNVRMEKRRRSVKPFLEEEGKGEWGKSDAGGRGRASRRSGQGCGRRRGNRALGEVGMHGLVGTTEKEACDV